jgi:hypothetical protein
MCVLLSGVQEVEGHLVSALRFPADRIPSSKKFLPSIRYFSEFVSTYKFTVRLRLLGFTLNPENIDTAVLERVLQRVPRAEFILLKRRNIVKLAISGDRHIQYIQYMYHCLLIYLPSSHLYYLI